jgi:hypothetical protein
LVHQESLACSRGFGDAWEPAEGEIDPRRQRATVGERRPLVVFAPAPRFALPGGGVFASSGVGDGGGGGGFRGSSRPERPATPPGQERTISFQPEERYWSDYLRIALPVAGLIILVFLLWYWAGQIIGGGTPTATVPFVVNTVPPDRPATPPATPTAPTPTPSVTVTPPPTPIPTEEIETPEAPTTDFPVYEVGEMVVTNGEANMRADASIDSDVVGDGPLSAGTELEITGPFVDGGEGQFDWWPVTNPATGETGFVREDLIERPS